MSSSYMEMFRIKKVFSRSGHTEQTYVYFVPIFRILVPDWYWRFSVTFNGTHIAMSHNYNRIFDGRWFRQCKVRVCQLNGNLPVAIGNINFNDPTHLLWLSDDNSRFIVAEGPKTDAIIEVSGNSFQAQQELISTQHNLFISSWCEMNKKQLAIYSRNSREILHYKFVLK